MRIAMSEPQPALAGSISQGSHAAVVQVATSIEHYRLHSGGAGALGDGLADSGRNGHGRTGAGNRLAQLELGARCGCKGPSRCVIHELDLDVAQAAEHGHARPRRGAADALAHAPMTAVACFTSVLLLVHRGVSPCSLGLARLAGFARLATQALAPVQDSLALVRLRLAERPD